MIFKTQIGNKPLSVETGTMAGQANGEVLVRYGDTEVLATAVMSKYPREGIDFFPLEVDYQERYYAAGKIYGSRFIRREARPSDEAILASRLVDRTIRPRFPQNAMRNEVQVILTVLSWDEKNDPDIPAILGASLALGISDIPWKGPVAGIRIGRIPGEKSSPFVVNPTYEERERSDLDLIAAGSSGERVSGTLINMFEGSGEEIAEKIVVEATQIAQEEIKKLIDWQNEIIKKCGKKKIEVEIPEPSPELKKEVKEFLNNKLEKALYQLDKLERMEKVNELKKDLRNFIQEKYNDSQKTKEAEDLFEEELEEILAKNILEKEKRPDGRKLDEIRLMESEVAVLPRTHGSGLFKRGQTQSLSILTLGAPGDVQLLEGMEIVGKKRFMHHYNFPPYCVGETGMMRGPGRREIGHGALAEKALKPLVPDYEQFPYTIRLVSEILSSNGSSSMASICSSSLALADGGVPIKEMAAGIAMGLIMKNQNYKILTDIQGPEDHRGDMDFKIAGTKKGITSLQMDVKIEGINLEILEKILKQAQKARLEILEKMKKTISGYRSQLSPYAPRILTLQINPQKIREVIGPGGKTINEIIAETGVSIDIEDSGRVMITSESEESAKKAMGWIKNITREIKIGEIFQGRVKKITNFGAFIEILPSQEGLLHISKMASFRVERVEDIMKVGDIIPVKVIGVDEQGKISLERVWQKKS